MRLFVIGITVFGLASTAWAGDAFDGDWKLNLEKSNFGARGKAKDGRVLIETVDKGYNHLTEIVFADGPSLRFVNRVRFDGEPENGTLDNHLIRYVSKQGGPNSFEVEISDADTGRVVKTIHADVAVFPAPSERERHSVDRSDRDSARLPEVFCRPNWRGSAASHLRVGT